jgi:ATP-binding cassette subfamily B protein
LAYRKHRMMFALCYGASFLVELGWKYAAVVFAQMVDFVASHPSDVNLIQGARPYLIVWIGLFVTLELIQRAYSYKVSVSVPWIKKQIRQDAYDAIMAQPPTYFIEKESGNISQRILQLSDAFDSMHYTMIWGFFMFGVRVIFTGVIMYIAHPLFAAILCVWLVLFLSLTMWRSHRVMVYAESMTDGDSRVASHIVDTIANALTVKLFGMAREERQHLGKYLTVSAEKNARLKRLIEIILIVNSLTINLLAAALVIGVIWAKAHNLITVGQLTLIIGLMIELAYITWNLGFNIMTWKEAQGRLNDSIRYLSEHAEKKSSQSSRKALVVKKGAIQFQDVSFHFDGQSALLKNFNLSIKPGERVGLVGYSGAGKTTLVRMLMGFYHPSAGHVTIDGKNLDKVSQESLADNIAFVPQDPSMFNRTIWENICYAKPDVSHRQVEQAARHAHAHDFIKALPKGYESVVGERGVKLSGGQRQRLSIARAILKDAPILILDEATSALDSESERLIQDALKKLMKGRTVIAIAHRLSTLKSLDRIVVMDKGCLIEEGTHADLLKKNGQYAKLWHMQTGAYLQTD